MTRLASKLAILTLLLPGAARADYHIVYPTEIDQGEWELEHNGARSFDYRPDVGGIQGYTVEIGTGVTSWWNTELELGFDNDPSLGQPVNPTQLVTENTVLLTEPGEYWADVAIYGEYGQGITHGRYATSNELTIGPAISKDIGRTTHTANLFFTRQLGPNQDTGGWDFNFAWQSRWNLWAPLSPAIEVYGDTGTIGQTPAFSHQQLLVGPVAVGALQLNQLGLGNAGKIKYELGWLVGATAASPTGVLRWRLELEIPF